MSEKKLNSNLKVGLLVDDSEMPIFAWHLIEAAKKSSKFSIECLIVQKRKESLKSRIFNKYKQFGLLWTISRISFQLISKFEFFFLKIFFDFKDIYTEKPLKFFDGKKIEVTPITNSTGFVYRFSDEDIMKIDSENLDVLIRCGSGIHKGKVLEISKYGVLSFHHGDSLNYRGSPAGFWEALEGEDTTGFVIQKLTNELDGGKIVFKGSISTRNTFILNQQAIYLKSLPFMVKVLENLSSRRSLNFIDDIQIYSSPLYKPPMINSQIRYIYILIKRSLRVLLKRSFGYKQRWRVAYKFKKDWKKSVLWRFKEIKNKKGRFFADPFPITFNNKSYIFVEDYFYKTKKGKISVLEVEENDYKFLGTALEEDFHLSFPFLFKVKDDLYMLPETSQCSEIRLYKCDEFPFKWSFHKTLMSNVNAVDSMILKKDNFWFMITNIDSSNLNEFESELHVFYSEKFDSGNWKEVGVNPTKFNPNYSRNGGLLMDGDNIYRVFQKQSFGIYGAGMGIAQILNLSPESYEEKKLTEIKSIFNKKAFSTHTMNSKNGLTVIDFAVKER